MLKETEDAIKSLNDLQNDINTSAPSDAPASPVAGVGSGSGGGGSDGKDPKATAVERRIEALRLEADALGKTRKQVELLRLENQGATEAEIMAATASLDRVDAFNKAQEAMASDLASAERREQDLNDLEDSLRSEEDAINDSYERRTQIVLDNTVDGSQKEIDLLEKLAAERKDALDALNEEDPFGLAEEFATRARENIQDSLADAIINGVRDGGRGALESFGDLLLQMAAEAVAADIMGSIFRSGTDGAQSGGGGGSGGNTASLVGGIASLFAGFFDSGGNIPSGQFGIAGENGPEIIRGPANVTSTKDTAAMMNSGNTNNINITMSGISDPGQARIAAGQVGREINTAIAAAQRVA